MRGYERNPKEREERFLLPQPTVRQEDGRQERIGCCTRNDGWLVAVESGAKGWELGRASLGSGNR
jgi:hypothetical protein